MARADSAASHADIHLDQNANADAGAWLRAIKADSVDANCSADRFVKVFMPTGWNDEPAGRYPLLAIELYRAPGDLRKPSWYAAP